MAIKILFIYALLAVMFYFIFALLLNSSLGADPEFDEAFEDKGNRLMALLFSSLIWPITIILIIFNGIKEEFKNGKND